MQTASQPAIPHIIQSAGIDWITATAQKGSTRWDMQEFADNERRRLMDANEPITSGYRLGYHGWQSNGFFHGQREGGSIIVASGATAHNVFRSVVNVSDHISRLDLQTTVSTLNDRPHLGVQAYRALKSGVPSKVKVKNATLINSQPQGETLCLGKRSSDWYGRLYDKASEAQLGEPRSLWRYEVEVKRSPANHLASGLVRSEAPEALASRLVWDYFNSRGVEPIYRPSEVFCPQKQFLSEPRRDVLTWFERTLSITVAKAVKRHGATAVVEALGLSPLVTVNPERSE